MLNYYFYRSLKLQNDKKISGEPGNTVPETYASLKVIQILYFIQHLIRTKTIMIIRTVIKNFTMLLIGLEVTVVILDVLKW